MCVSLSRMPARMSHRSLMAVAFTAALGACLAREICITRAAAAPAPAGPPFVEFESGHVRPLAMSPDGTTLFAVNTPNGTLEAFDLTTGALTLKFRVPV